MKEKTAKNVRDAVKSMIRELKVHGGTNSPNVVRLHSDDDPSFEGELSEYCIENQIWQTDTGGYRPQNNARVERRIRMVNECFRANLFQANGGIDTYEKLWGYGLHHAIAMVNRSTWSDGRSPYHSLTQTEYKWTKDDHIFGCGVEYYVPLERA